MKQGQPINAYARATSSDQQTTNTVGTAGAEGSGKMPDTRGLPGSARLKDWPLEAHSLIAESERKPKGIATNDPLHVPVVNVVVAHTVKQEQPSLPFSRESSVEEISPCQWVHSRLTRPATGAEATKTNKTNKDPSGYHTQSHHDSEGQQKRPPCGDRAKYEEAPAPAVREVAEQKRYEPYNSCQPIKMTYQTAPLHHHNGRQENQPPHHTVQNPGRDNAGRQDHRQGEEYVFRDPQVESQKNSNATYLHHQRGAYNQQPAAAPFLNDTLQHETLQQRVGEYNIKNVNLRDEEATISSHQAHVSNYPGVSHINDQERGWRAHTIQKSDQHQESHDNRRGGIQYDDQYYNRTRPEQRHHETQYEGKDDGERMYQRRHYEGKYYEERKPYQPNYEGKYYRYGAKHYHYEQTHDVQEVYTRKQYEVSQPDKQYGGHHYNAGEYTSEKKNVEPKDNERRYGGGYKEKMSHGENIHSENEHPQRSGPKAEDIRHHERESNTKRGPMFGTFMPQITTGRRSQIATTVNAERTGSPVSHAKTQYKQDIPLFRLRYYPEHMRPLEHYSYEDETPSAHWSIRGRESTQANSPLVDNTAPQDPFGIGHCELPKRGGANGGHVYGRGVKEPTPGPAPELGSLFQATRGEKRQRDEPEVWGGIKVSRYEWDGRAIGKDAQGREFIFGTREQMKWHG